MLKTIVVVNDFDYIQGGASKVALDTAEMLFQKGYQIIFFSGTHSSDSPLNKNDYQCISLNQPECLRDTNRLRGAIRGIYNFKAKKELRKLLKQLNPSETIIHVHGWTKTLSSSVFGIALRMKFKLVLTLHDYFTACPNGGFFDYPENKICPLNAFSFQCVKKNCDSRNYLFKCYRLIRHFIQRNVIGLNRKLKYAVGISKLNIEILQKYLPSISIKYIANPFPIHNHIQDNILKHEYYIFLGRVDITKGIKLFCDAMEQLYQTHQIKSLVIGDGPALEECQKEYPHVKFVGWKENQEALEYFRNARGFILPSRLYEGAPLTPIEAMSYGIPCIVSDCCAAREYINQENGFLCQLEASSICEQVLKLEENLSFYSSGALNYYQKLKEKEYSKELIHYFESVLSEEQI